MAFRSAALAFAVAVLAATAASAVLPPKLPQHRVDYSNLFVFRYNPLGLQDVFDIGYKFRLYDSEEVLWRTGYVGASFVPTVSPAFVKLGIQTEIEPIAVLKLQAKWEWIQYFGILDHLQSFQNVDADYSDTAIKAGGDADRNYAGGGWQAMLAAEVKARVGPVVIRNRLQAYYSDMDLRSGDTVWMDPAFDLLTPGKGWTLINDADLLTFLLEDRLIVGVRHTLLESFFPDEAFGDGGSRDLDNYPINRVGPLVAWHVYDDPGQPFARLTILLVVQWLITHPTRAGQDVNQGIPFMALGCAINGDLLRVE